MRPFSCSLILQLLQGPRRRGIGLCFVAMEAGEASEFHIRTNGVQDPRNQARGREDLRQGLIGESHQIHDGFWFPPGSGNRGESYFS